MFFCFNNFDKYFHARIPNQMHKIYNNLNLIIVVWVRVYVFLMDVA